MYNLHLEDDCPRCLRFKDGTCPVLNRLVEPPVEYPPCVGLVEAPEAEPVATPMAAPPEPAEPVPTPEATPEAAPIRVPPRWNPF